MVAVMVADGGVKTWSRRHGHMTSPQTVATLRRGESRDHSTVMAGAGGGVSVSVAVAVSVAVSVSLLLAMEVADGGVKTRMQRHSHTRRCLALRKLGR
jgi:hypothetical protein